MTDERAEETFSLFSLLEERARRHPSHVAMRTRRGGAWEWSTWGDLHGAAVAVAAALIERGVGKGDRVAILARSREEWAVVDFGIFAAGAVTVPIYPTSTSERVRFILENAGVSVVITEGPRELDVVRRALSPACRVRDIVVIDGARIVAAPSEHEPSCATTSYTDFLRAGRDALALRNVDALVRERRAGARRGDVATVVYTSGTTGTPRGVALTHGGLSAEVTALLAAFDLGPSDEQLLMLPLSHILARVLLLSQVASGSRLAFSEGPHRFVNDLREVEPTFFTAVPRFFEKVFAVANDSARAQGPLKSALWSWAVAAGERAAEKKRSGAHLGVFDAARARYADKLALERVRRSFGKKLKFAISGGAPLPRDLAEWFHACGILILEGYGLTEVAGASHVNREKDFRFGSVGRPLPGVEATTAADGEVLLRGPTLMKGYFGEDGTPNAIDEDGWFHTGDIGVIEERGFLTIQDRKKDVIVTAGGSNVAPQSIERMLAASPWLSHAVVFGDREPYLVALVTLNVTACQRWARENGRADDIESLSRDPELAHLIQLDVDGVNQRLTSYETIKRFAVLDREFTVEAQELTDLHKVRRARILARYSDVIDSLYGR